MTAERLQKRLARAGVASRRACEDLISAGRVTVNGRQAGLGSRVEPADLVCVDGVPLAAAAETVTYLLHKPAGYVTTAHDELGRETVLSAMPAVPGLHPVGRLDMDSEGLLLLTTDGELTQQLTHPRYGHEKAYRVWCWDEPDAGALADLRRGVMLEDGPAQALEVQPAPGGALVVLGEGRKRQVRRMLEATGFPVRRLLRYRLGGLYLGDLQPGEYRELSARELEVLLSPQLLGAGERRRLERQTLDLWA
ncbi:pseudouridine synthase [Deinococcus lacus]|uniref:Pseudouridine synthase n=1 Tax=Deinococcus lacus TaxID=392561 RepID=A0ABW1Y9R5_9DEIO